MNVSTGMSNKTSTAYSCHARVDQIQKNLILRTRICIFVLNKKLNNYLKSGYQQENIKNCLGRAD